MVNKVTNRVTICQAWFVVSTATGLFMPMVQKLASEVPCVIRDIENYDASTTSLNKLVNMRNAKTKTQLQPQNFNTQPRKINYQQPMLEKMSTVTPHKQHR